MTMIPPASPHSPTGLALLAVSLLFVGCSQPATNSSAVGSAQPSVAVPADQGLPTVSPGATATPDADVSPGETPYADLKQPQVTGIQVTPDSGGFTVRGVLSTAEGKPIVGAVGDFYLEGARANLIQSYATDVDGSFHARFTNAEAPAWADLMMHFRGDSNNAPGSFLIRKATEPRPASPTATAKPTTPAAQPSTAVPAAPSVPAASSAPATPSASAKPTPKPTPTPTPTPTPAAP